jgi:hypothetical protein
VLHGIHPSTNLHSDPHGSSHRISSVKSGSRTTYDSAAAVAKKQQLVGVPNKLPRVVPNAREIAFRATVIALIARMHQIRTWYQVN